MKPLTAPLVLALASMVTTASAAMESVSEDDPKAGGDAPEAGRGLEQQTRLLLGFHQNIQTAKEVAERLRNTWETVSGNSRFGRLLDTAKELALGARQEDSQGGLISILLKAFGMGDTELGKLAMDVIIYVVDLAARRFLGDEEVMENEIPTYRSIVQEEGFIPGISAIFRASPRRAAAVRSALSARSLPNTMIEGLRNRTGQNTACLQLFLCKLSPAIWGVQDVFSDSPMDYSRSLSYNLRLWTDLIWERVPNSLEPTEQEEKEGQECEKKFPQCALTDFKKVLGTNE